jgi:hypothetical protein
MAEGNNRIIDGPDVWAQLLGGNAPALKYADGTFIVKFNEEQERDENGRWTSTGGGSMPYKLTPQTETKHMFYLRKGISYFYDVGGTPERNVRAFLATQASRDNPYEAFAKILDEPDAPKLPLTDEELNRGVQGTYAGQENGWKTFDDVPEELRDSVLDDVLRNNVDEKELQAYYSEQRDFIHEKMNDLVLPDGRTVGETMDLMADDSLAQLQELAQTAPLSLTMPDSRLTKFLTDERYKTVFEVSSPNKGSARALYLDARTEVETKLGIPEDTYNENRPVYGTLGGGGMEYGNAMITMDDAVRDRTTITIGDSIDGAASGYLNLGELANGTVSREDFWQAAGERISRWSGNPNVSTWWNYTGENRISGYKGVDDIKLMGDNHYLEAQFHGGIKLSDIVSITVPPSYKISGANQTKLDDLDITVDRKSSSWSGD